APTTRSTSTASAACTTASPTAPASSTSPTSPTNMSASTTWWIRRASWRWRCWSCWEEMSDLAVDSLPLAGRDQGWGEQHAPCLRPQLPPHRAVIPGRGAERRDLGDPRSLSCGSGHRMGPRDRRCAASGDDGPGGGEGDQRASGHPPPPTPQTTQFRFLPNRSRIIYKPLRKAAATGRTDMRNSLVPLAIAGALLAATAITPVLAQARTDVNVGLVLEPPNLDPTAGAAAAIDEVVYANVFEGLTRFAPDGSIVPALAESWAVSEDGLTSTFHLRAGVTFHDGSTMDAEDVVFSLDRARAEDSVNAQKWLFTDIAAVEATDPQTVTVTLSRPNGNFPFNMAWGDAVIVAPESAENNATNPIGTGPFTFVDWAQGNRIDIARNDNYWGEPVALESASFRFIADPTAAFAALQAGDVDAFANFPAPETVVQF